MRLKVVEKIKGTLSTKDLAGLLASRVRKSASRIDLMSKRERLLLGLLIVVVMGAICYVFVGLSVYMEEFKTWGPLGAFLASLITGASIFEPVPMFLVMGAIAAVGGSNWALVGAASAAGGALGGITWYLVGCGGRIVMHKESSAWYCRAEGWMKRYGSWTIFFFALAFLPVEVVGIVAGALHFPYWKYILSVFFGYLLKNIGECYLAHSVWQRCPLLREVLSSVSWWGWVLIAAGIVLIVTGIVLFWLKTSLKDRQTEVRYSGKDIR